MGRGEGADGWLYCGEPVEFAAVCALQAPQTMHSTKKREKRMNKKKKTAHLLVSIVLYTRSVGCNHFYFDCLSVMGLYDCFGGFSVICIISYLIRLFRFSERRGVEYRFDLESQLNSSFAYPRISRPSLVENSLAAPCRYG